MKDMDMVVAELENGLDGMSAKARTAALSTIFGAESVAGWTALIDRGSKELKTYTGELENAEGAASEMAATMQDNARGKIVEFQSALEGIGISLAEHMIPTVTDFIEKGTEMVRKFGELDEGTQKNIIKMGLFAAAIGPAAVVMGNLTTATGGLLRVGSKVAGMLGTASAAGKGSGLLGSIAALGPAKATPVGLAIAGVGLLGVGAYNLYKDLRQVHDISTETADAFMEQYQSNNELIDSFDELRSRSRLTNDEFARYLDLQTRLESETRPEAIELIKDAMAELQEKSGLSNEELNQLIGYNNSITEVLPESTAQITEQGNRVADTTDKLRDYNQEIANMARRELEAELQKSLANELEIREQIKEEQVELNRLTELESGLREVMKSMQDGTIETLQEKLLAEQASVEEAIREQQMRGEVSQELLNQQDNIWRLIELSGMDLEVVRETLGETINTVDAQRDLIAEKEADLNKTGEIVAKMVEYELIAAGINEETARQVVKDAEVSALLDEQLRSLEKQKKELDKQYPAAMQMTDEYKEAKQEIDEHIGKLQQAKGNIQDLIGEAGEYNTELAKDISKSVNVTTEPTIDRFNYLLSMPLTRQITIRQTGGLNYPTYAEGTNSHPGGPFIAGEEGWELGRLGNRWEVLNAGLYDRPRGYEVFPHDESKKIMSALNNIPAYADGAIPNGEANRVVSQLNQQPMSDSNGQVVSLLRDIAQGIREGKVIQIGSRVITDTVNETNAVDALGNYF